MYTAFINPGEVPVNAFKLLGASSKRGDASKIGFFGTGLKYALAVLLREGVDFRVFSGLKEIKIGTRTTDFAGQKVQVITVNGEKTSITIDAGIDWKGWYAIREIYSNAIDEGGSIEIEELKPEAGKTKIYIRDEEHKLGDVFSNWQRYFAAKRKPLFANSDGRILPKMVGQQGFNVYRKGILVLEEPRMSLFDYDINDIEINESRVVKYRFMASKMASTMVAHAPVDIINQVFALMRDKNRSEYLEWQNEFWEYTSGFSESWIEAINGRELVPNDYAGKFELDETSLVLPDRLIDKLKNYFGKQIKSPGDGENYIIDKDQSGVAALSPAFKRLAAIGYEYEGETVIVHFNSRNTYGMCADGKIFIDKRVLDMTDRDIDMVLLEEIVHYHTGYDDFSRELQTYLFKEVINLANKLHKQA